MGKGYIGRWVARLAGGYMQIERQADRHEDRQKDKWTNRHKDRQTDMRTNMQGNKIDMCTDRQT